MNWMRKAYLEAQAAEKAKNPPAFVVTPGLKIPKELQADKIKDLYSVLWPNNGPQSVLEPTVTGVDLAAGGHVALVSQDDPSENGVYTVSIGSGGGASEFSQSQLDIDYSGIPLTAALECLTAHSILPKQIQLEMDYHHGVVINLELAIIGKPTDALDAAHKLQQWAAGKKFKVK